MDGRELRGGVLSFTDMTATRAAEASLREAVQARDEVLAVVSHDLRNPVGTIVSGASLLLTLDPGPEKQKEHLQAIKRSAQRINRLIQDLLDVARMEVGALSIHPGPFQVDPLLEELVEANREQAIGRGLVLVADAAQGGVKGWGDRHRVIQALTNLVENALRETPAGGQITLGASAEPHGGGLRFSVSDTGPGIPLEDRERLFDRFWQVSRRGGGAGLGLSIVKGIAEAHGGTVGVETAHGEGSCFWFTLPPGSEEEG
jgi:signal transduction histidine kinase